MKRVRIKRLHKALIVLFGLCLVGGLASLWFDAKQSIIALQDAGWASYVGAPGDSKAAFGFSCLSNGSCRPVLWNQFRQYDLTLLTQALWVGFGVFMLLALAVSFFADAAPDEKDPGGGNFATDEDLDAYLKKDKGRDNPRRGHYGYTESGKQLRAPLRDRCTHLAIFAGTGGGKTTRIIKPSLIQDALDGTSVLMVDPKWPDPKGGYSDLLAIYKDQGYEVQVFCPFEEKTLRLPLIGSLTSRADADVLAATIMPKASGEGSEGVTFYRNQERELLKHLLWGEAQAGRGSVGDVYNLLDRGPAAIRSWVAACKDPRIVDSMGTLLELRHETVIGLLQGLKGTLNIFTNAQLDAATQAGRYGWQNLSPTSLTERKSVMYVGIPQQMFLRGEGKLLLNLFFRRIMDEILTVAQNEGGSLARHLAVYIDEFAHVGRLEDAGSWFGTMRSYNIAFTVALQNRAQLELVYGTVGAKAMEGGNFQHLITFPASLRGDDKEYVSRLLGEVTAEEVTTSVSRQHLFDLPRRTTTRRRVARPLLSREEMDKWNPDYGVLLPHGAGPTKIAAPMIQQKRVGAARNRFYRFRNDVGAGNSLALVESLLSRHKLAWLTEHPPEPEKARGDKPVAEEEPFVFTETQEAETPAQPKADKKKGTVAKADEPQTPRPAQVVSAPDAPPPARKKAAKDGKTPEQQPAKKPAHQAPASAAKLHLVPNGELMPSFRTWVEGLAWQSVPLTVFRVREGGRDRASKVLFDRLPGALRHEHLEHWKQRHWLRIHRGKLGIVNHGCTVLCPAQLEAFMASPRAQVVEIGEGSERVVVKARAENERTEVLEHGEKRDEATLTLGAATASRTGSSAPASREDPSVQAALRAWVAGNGFRLQGHPSHDSLLAPNEDLLGRFFPETVTVPETYLRGLNDFPLKTLEAFPSVGQKKNVMREIPGGLVRRVAPLKRLLGTDAHLLENHPACKDKERAIGRYQEQGVFLLKSTATEVTGIAFDDAEVSPRKIGTGNNKKSKRVVYLPLHPELLTAPIA